MIIVHGVGVGLRSTVERLNIIVPFEIGPVGTIIFCAVWSDCTRNGFDGIVEDRFPLVTSGNHSCRCGSSSFAYAPRKGHYETAPLQKRGWCTVQEDVVSLNLCLWHRYRWNGTWIEDPNTSWAPDPSHATSNVAICFSFSLLPFIVFLGFLRSTNTSFKSIARPFSVSF